MTKNRDTTVNGRGQCARGSEVYVSSTVDLELKDDFTEVERASFGEFVAECQCCSYGGRIKVKAGSSISGTFWTEGSSAPFGPNFAVYEKVLDSDLWIDNQS